MTGALLRSLGAVRGPILLRLSLTSLAAFLLPATLLLDAASWLRSCLRTASVLSKTEWHCPRGHVVGLLGGAWTCGACKFVLEGHGFAACPACGTVAHAIWCPCGLSVVNPLFRSGKGWGS